MGKHYFRFHLVYVLSACTTASRSLHFYIGIFYLDIDRIINERITKNRSKRSMSPRIAVKWRYTYQPVNTTFSFQETIRKWPVKLKGGCFNTCTVSPYPVQFGYFPPLP